LAASASKPETQDMGSNVMVAGVILQMIVMVLYSILLVDFVIHYMNDRPVRNRRTAYQAKDVKAILPQEEVKKARILLMAMVVSTILIFIRSVCESCLS
jgi:H+/gluconate symporter-like permease